MDIFRSVTIHDVLIWARNVEELTTITSQVQKSLEEQDLLCLLGLMRSASGQYTLTTEQMLKGYIQQTIRFEAPILNDVLFVCSSFWNCKLPVKVMPYIEVFAH